MTFVLHLDSGPEENDEVEDQDGAVDDVSVDGIGQKVSHLPQGVAAAVTSSFLSGLLRVDLWSSSLAAMSQVDTDTADDVERQEDDGGDEGAAVQGQPVQDVLVLEQ